jgi:hypothetical protein
MSGSDSLLRSKSRVAPASPKTSVRNRPAASVGSAHTKNLVVILASVYFKGDGFSSLYFQGFSCFTIWFQGSEPFLAIRHSWLKYRNTRVYIHYKTPRYSFCPPIQMGYHILTVPKLTVSWQLFRESRDGNNCLLSRLSDISQILDLLSFTKGVCSRRKRTLRTFSRIPFSGRDRGFWTSF